MVSGVGAISDASTSKYRRRYWIVLSTVALVISTLTIAYCREIAAFFVDLFGGGLGDWDPKRQAQVILLEMHLCLAVAQGV